MKKKEAKVIKSLANNNVWVMKTSTHRHVCMHTYTHTRRHMYTYVHTLLVIQYKNVYCYTKGRLIVVPAILQLPSTAFCTSPIVHNAVEGS